MSRFLHSLMGSPPRLPTSAAYRWPQHPVRWHADGHTLRHPDAYPAYLRFLSHDMMPAMRERQELLQPLRADAAALLALLAADPEVRGVSGSGSCRLGGRAGRVGACLGAVRLIWLFICCCSPSGGSAPQIPVNTIHPPPPPLPQQTRNSVAWCEGQVCCAVMSGVVPPGEPGVSALLARFAAQAAGTGAAGARGAGAAGAGGMAGAVPVPPPAGP